MCSKSLKSQGWVGEREGEKVVSVKTTPLVSNLCKQNGGADNSEGKTAVGMELQQSLFPTGIKGALPGFLKSEKTGHGVCFQTPNTDTQMSPPLKEGLT